jgi:hypothetical protein
MLISSILRVHQDAALPANDHVINDRNIGDAFLYRNSPIFRNLRDCYRAFGYRFTTEDFCYLFDLPLFSLEQILRRRLIPIHDTVSPLADLTLRFPEAEFDDLSFDSLLAYPINHILHHSVHCVSDHVTAGLIGSAEWLGQSPLAVLRILICESFGNAIDVLSNIDSHRWEEEGRALFIMNNIVSKTADECEPYALLIERAGWKTGIRIVSLFYLFRNLLGESIDTDFLRRALDSFGIRTNEDLEGLVALFDRTNLTADFRINTTTRYFRYLGFQFRDLLELYDFDLLELVDANAGVAQTFDAMAELIASGSESPYFARFRSAGVLAG